MKKLRTGSDFSGVGAFDQAITRLGIEQDKVFACDMDKFARQTYIHNYGMPDYFPENVYDREIPTEPLDIYMTSPPCQAFSLAGNRKGEEDDRGILFYNSHEFIEKNRPKSFIFENVKGLLSDDGGKTFQRWLDYLGGKSVNGNTVIFPHDKAVPYHIYWRVLNAKNYNIPQNRERVFIVGIRNDDHYFTWPKEMRLTKCLVDILDPEVDEKYFLSDKILDGFIAHSQRHNEKGNGFKFLPLDENDISTCISARYYKSGPSDPYVKIKSATKKGYETAQIGDSINFSQPTSQTRRGRVGKGVAQTLDTACNPGVVIGAIRGRNPDKSTARLKGQPHIQMLEINLGNLTNTITSVQKDNVMIQLNPSKESGGYKIRRLTPRECFRAMDFPESFSWPVSDSQAYKQAGNSICVGVLAAILEKLIPNII